MSRASQAAYDRHITIFSPEGKLFQLEYALKAVKNCNVTGLAVKDGNGIAVVSQKKLPAQQGNQDILLDASSVTNIYHVTDEILILLIGLPVDNLSVSLALCKKTRKTPMNLHIGPLGDCLSILYKAREIAMEYAYKYGCNINASVLCQRVADINQYVSLHTRHTPIIAGLIMSIDEENGPSIFKFDASGWYAGYKACGIGAKEQEAEGVLEKILKRREASAMRDTMRSNLEVNTDSNKVVEGPGTKVTIEALKAMLDVDAFTQGTGAPSIEVAVATKDNPVFRQLTEDEIETYLTHIAESD